MTDPRKVPLTPREHLRNVSRAYEKAADEYHGIAKAAAVAEAAHKAARAKAILRYRAADDVKSFAEAEARAEADDEIAGLHQARLIAAALADSHKQKLLQLREQVATGRTAVASDRVADQQHAAGLTGAA